MNLHDPPAGTIRASLRYPAFRWLLSGLSALAVLAIPAVPGFLPGQPEEEPTGLLRGVAEGAAVLRAYPQALRLVGADIMCSLVYGMQTVLLLLVARQAGLGLHGYGYLFTSIGVGAVGLPMVVLAVTHWAAAALVLVAISGTGAILVEVLTETRLQRTLPAEMFGRAYGLALPASIGGLAADSLIAPLLTSMSGGTGTLVACGAAVVAYGLLILRVPKPKPDLSPAENALICGEWNLPNPTSASSLSRGDQ